MVTATPGRLSPLFNAVTAAREMMKKKPPNQGSLEQFANAVLFVTHTQNLPTLRGLHDLLGSRMRVFGGETLATFDEARGLMAREPEKIDWFSGPLQDRADYLTKSYMPFLLAGPNHRLRREHIVGKVAQAWSKLSDLEALLDEEEEDADRALVRFMFKQFCAVELDPNEVSWFLDFKRRAQPLVLLPKLLRNTLLRSTHEELTERRLYFLKRIEAAGEPIADSWFDVLWFNAATLWFYPEKALEHLKAEPRLQPPVRDEVLLPPGQRHKTRALIQEMLRIHGRIASTNYVEQGHVRVALLATAVVDPVRYNDPLKVDLSRDHSDTIAFSGPAPTRKCPAEKFAPDAMAAVVAQRVRTGALERLKVRGRS
jgi:hypothetical protein